MNNDVVVKEIKCQLKQGSFASEKTGELIKYYYIYIPEIKKRVKVKFEELEKDVLGLNK